LDIWSIGSIYHRMRTSLYRYGISTTKQGPRKMSI